MTYAPSYIPDDQSNLLRLQAEKLRRTALERKYDSFSQHRDDILKTPLVEAFTTAQTNGLNGDNSAAERRVMISRLFEAAIAEGDITFKNEKSVLEIAEEMKDYGMILGIHPHTACQAIDSVKQQAAALKLGA